MADGQETSPDIVNEPREKLPALTENTFLRYFTFIVLYVSQGIPEGMTYFGIPAWLAMNGKTPGEIGGYVATIGIPWSFKIIVAPLMDRFSYLPMGRRRPWVLFGQLGLICSFIALAFVQDPLNNLFGLKFAAFFVSFFGAFQDVGTDGMAIDVVPVNEQARANGLMWGAKTIGTSVSLVIGNWIINHYGFTIAILCLSVAVCLIMLVPLLLRERPGEKLLPWTPGKIHPHSDEVQLDSWSHILKGLMHVFFLPGSILMGIAVYSISVAIGLMDTLLPVFTIQGAGWTDTEYSRVISVCNIIAGFLGMIAGGALADFYGKKRMMTIYLILIMLLVGVMALVKSWWHTSFVIVGFIGIYSTLYVFLTIVIFATAMELSWKRVAATQFTAFMAIANIGRATGSGILGPMRTAMPWEYVIASIGAFALAMLILIRLLKLKKHVAKLVVLESDYILHENEEHHFKNVVGK